MVLAKIDHVLDIQIIAKMAHLFFPMEGHRNGLFWRWDYVILDQ